MGNCIFESKTDTTSATICKHCGKEKWEHTISSITHTEIKISKLYTEEQLKQVISIFNTERFVSTDELLEELKLTPIELPTDEEIEKIAFVLYDKRASIFTDGVEWMRNKIKGAEE